MLVAAVTSRRQDKDRWKKACGCEIEIKRNLLPHSNDHREADAAQTKCQNQWRPQNRSEKTLLAARYRTRLTILAPTIPKTPACPPCVIKSCPEEEC